MKTHWRYWSSTTLSEALVLCFAAVATAQTGATAGPNTPPNMKTGRDTNPLNAENTLEMSTPQEDEAFRSFEGISYEKTSKKIQAGENFLKKYNTSRYRQQIYAILAIAYIQIGQPEKGIAAGENSVQLNPKDVHTMGVLSQTLARISNPDQPNAAADLAKAEEYGKKALEVTPTLKKPDGANEKEFQEFKDQALAMAYSGLGLVDVRKGKYGEAIPDLEQACKLDPKKDPANFYLLGIANQNTSHFTEAAAAFGKCAEINGNLQQTCKDGAEEAKKRAAGQTTPKK